MKFYNSLGPNPRCVRMFMAEKGISIPSTEVNLMAADNRKPPYTDKNPGGQMPALELDNGSTLGETVAICEYLEEKNPTPAFSWGDRRRTCRNPHVAASHRTQHHRTSV